MRESEFQKAYHEQQQAITASRELRNKTAAAIFESTQNKHDTSQEAPGSTPYHKASRLSATRTSPCRRPRPWWIAVAAACFVVALVFGLNLTSHNTDSNGPDTFFSSDFAIKAYASETNSLLELGDDGRIIFDRDTTINSATGAFTEPAEAYYTGCLFSVEGVGIARVQATIDGGELYRFTYEEITMGSDPEKVKEALGWKPTKVGLGTYYSHVDNLKVNYINDGREHGDPEKLYQVGLIKRLGQTIDVPIDQPAKTKTYFGLWTETPENNENNSFNPFDEELINMFDGKTLTVTVVFEDGHCSTQVIKLHAAYMRCKQVDNAIGTAQGIQIFPEIVDTTAMTQEEIQAGYFLNHIRSLYGEVVETNNDPFPGSLDDANKREHLLDEPAIVERQGDLLPTEDIILDRTAIHAPSETVRFKGCYLDEEGYDLISSESFELKLIDSMHSNKLPEGATVADSLELAGFLGDFEYMNRSSDQTFGYRVNHDGTITGSRSFITLTFDVTNPSSNVQSLSLYSLGFRFGVLNDDESHFSYVTGFMFDNSLFKSVKDSKTQNVIFQPGETKRITSITVLPNSVLENPSIMTILNSDDPSALRAIPLYQFIR